MRTLIFIVAYQAERHIEEVLSRIPAALLARDDVRVLCIDDASTDRTADLAAGWARARQVRNMVVLRNRTNQGYGGNQKLGYRYAIDEGFDAVILLHGDGQYAPELLGDFITELEDGQADVVLGTRMFSVASAWRGGMPLYKIVGNKILTAFQNAVTGARLSEFHTGYRAYSTAFLRSVPFELNDAAFHFDSEILLQAFNMDAKIAEIPIPTHYGTEVCHVDGLRYAWDVVRATLQYRMQRLGLFCSLKYRRSSTERYADKAAMPGSTHAVAFDELQRRGVRNVLDIGCGPAHLADRLSTKGVRVVAVDRQRPEATRVAEFHELDIERQPLPTSIFDHEAVLLLDVVEHLANPEEFLLGLRRARGRRSDDAAAGTMPTMIVSTPNVAFIAMRLNLLLGRFSYAERGILDIDHKRLFTRATLATLLRDCGYDIESWHPVGPPVELLLGGRLGRALGAFTSFLARLHSRLFAFQFVVVCRPRPSVHQLLYQDAAAVAGEIGTGGGRNAA